MSMRMRRTKKILSVSMLIAMFLNIGLPQSLTLVHAATNTSQQSPSSGTFDAKEVNRILDGLTPEQKANINKLTGAENSQKIHVNQKDFRSSKPINVIVQFKQDPAKIQIIKQALKNGGATLNSQAFADEYSAAQKRVADSHANFKNFLNAQAKTQIMGGQPVNKAMKITREFSEAYNGVSLSLPANLLTSLAENPEVASIWSVETIEVPESSNTVNAAEASGFVGKATSALKLLGLDKLQAEGHTGFFKSGPNAGKRVKVGVLDTGIDYNHPDLYKATHDANGNLYGGHDFVNSVIDSSDNVKFIDDKDPMETVYSDWLYAKANPNMVLNPPTQNYKDYITEHGTHVSGTIAANTTNNNATYSANGVAPDVELHGYRVLGPGGRGLGDGILNGIDQAVKDGMQVINLSLGSATNDPLSPNSIAINNATIVGVTCVVSAGNNGPGAATVGSPGTAPLAITIGASTIPVEVPVLTMKNGTIPYQARLFGKSFKDNDNPFAGQTLPIVDVGLGGPSDYQGKDLAGKMALVKRGNGLLTGKMANAKAAGAKGMIIWNNIADENNQGYMVPTLGTSMDNIYSVSITQAQGQALVDAIHNDPTTATMTFPSSLDESIWKNGDELAGFSSTGPVKNYDMKPDVISPGVDIISTVPFDVYEPQEGQTHDYTYCYQSMQGTSMAAPHTAGIAALILAAHPDYKPADVKASLMNTAKDVNTESTTYSVYQVGAGRVDPVRAINTDVKIEVLDKANNYDDPRYQYDPNATMTQIDDIRGSIFFGFKGRGEGAKDGSDDVVSTKDFNIINQGTSSKTFKVSSAFISTKFAGSNPVGPGTGNDVKVDVSVNNANTTSITVGGASSVKATAKMLVPSNAMEGTYEGYLNLVNASDSTESYRIPFTITVAEKGIDFKVQVKATTLTERYTGNYNPMGGAPGSLYSYSFNGEMKSMYLLLKDKEGNYLGLVQNVTGINGAPGVIYNNKPMLPNGLYFPFTKSYNGSLDQSGIASTPVPAKEGAYSVEMIATDNTGKQYKDEDTVYVDYQAPTMKMDSDAQPGIYEIDPTGYQTGQTVKTFGGTVYDSNIDVMKNNGEVSVPGLADPSKLVPVNQGLNTVWLYQDFDYATASFSTDASGRFQFGISPEDIRPEGSEVRIYPTDYAGAGHFLNKLRYYFIKKGSPYVTLTSSGGVDSGLESQGKVVIEPNKPFKATLATKNGVGMTGGQFTINDAKFYQFSNIRLSDAYKQYLESKGITPTLTVSAPYLSPEISGNNIDITISGIDAAGALDHDINILEADVTFIHPDPLIGPNEFDVTKSSFRFSGKDTKVPTFLANWPYLKTPTSMMTGGIFAESFRANILSGNFMNETVASGAKVTVTDANGKSFSTDNPTTSNNTVSYLGNTAGTYSVAMDASDKPYDVEVSMPGHFKDYFKTPVIGSNRYGYITGSYFDRASYDTPLLLGGDVNGDNVIDMKDLLAEVEAYKNYTALTTTTDKKSFLNNPVNRKYDIRWVPTTNPSGYGIDYYDFYYIFKNFNQVNQSAINAGVNVPSPQLTLTEDTLVNGVQLKAGDGLDKVLAALHFAGPLLKTTALKIPTLEELQNGTAITLIPKDTVYLDDIFWRKAITNILIDSTDVTNALVPNTSKQAVTITAAYSYGSPATYVPAAITLDGSLFANTGNKTVTVKATGYQDVTLSFTVSALPIPTPTIPLVTDPQKAHLGKDLTYTFTDDAKWRNGINKIVVKKNGVTTGLDITDLKDGSGNKYYDISQPGQITFKADLFKTDAVLKTSDATTYSNATINPSGANYLPALYKFEINSVGTDGTVYPLVTVGTNTGDSGLNAAQAVGYGITFDSQGGSAINTTAVGYRPSLSKYGTNASDLTIGFSNPKPTKPGYVFMGWYNEPAATTSFNPSTLLTADKTVYAKWDMNTTQNYSLVDQNNPNGLKFDGNSATSGMGWVLGEGNLKINIPDYRTNLTWLTDKNSIANIQATYYKLKSDGTGEATPTTYTMDPSTYDLIANADGSATLSFTTATESYALAHPDEKFAFSAAPAIKAPYNGYQLTVTATSGQTSQINNVRLGYRRHIDLNGGTLKVLPTGNVYFNDSLVNGKGTPPDMTNAKIYVENGGLSISNTLYLDREGTSSKALDLSNLVSLTDNATYYLCWIKTPPAVSKDTVGNTVGSDITLTFTEDGTWKNNIKHVFIGSKELVQNNDYTMTNNSITLNKALFPVGQKFNVVIQSEGYADAVVSDQVIGYEVTFESNGGDAVDSQIVDSRVTKPEDPTQAGYKFAGWYVDQALTTPFDFTSIVTKPITLYAKYALAASIVTPDTKDNALGNDMTLEFSDADWAKAISGITINGYALDGTKYKVDSTLGTITLDKSLFTKIGSYIIVISATDYADVTVSQKVVNGINVHFVLDHAPFEVKDQIVVRRITEPVVYGYDLTWFLDADCTIPWNFTNSIYSEKTLYGKWSLHKFSFVFDKQDGGLADSKTGEFGKTITAPTAPTRPGYAFLGWYKDAEGKIAWNFAADKVTGDTILYAKWATGVENNGLYNKDVTIIFNEATAKIDGKAFTSGTKVTSEGDHTLVVTDASGNATTIQFTIDKTVPTVSGVENNSFYNHNVTLAFNEPAGLLNGERVTNGTVVSKEGTYQLVVTDAAGNVTTVNFTIDKTAPVVTGVNNNGLYNKDMIVTFNEGTATLDGNNFISGTAVSTEGRHTLVVTDKAGNVTTVQFIIDKTAPVVAGVVNNGFYNHNVTLSFNELGGLLNGTPIPSGTIVKKEGTYTLVVTDAAGNVTTVKFTIDKTAPKAPMVNKVTSTTTLVTGTAEPGTKIYVRVGSKIIGTGIADKYGHFTISIDKQKVGTSLYVTAEDEAGNESDATKVTVSK
ncbi:S8 family serine peptidase [Neobacillus bataviensis]|uniref:S8 family serine peptidase n=1 Tax=Neobacillus bataviensis TaxID=220685 RepID=UPI001CBDA9B8|nr:S8 family serine peptidase [Neobacillus bataviensis]